MPLAQKKLKAATALFSVLLVSTSVSCAAPGDRGRPQGPPPEAIEACSGLSEGDACSFSGRRDDVVEGLCMVSRRGDEGLVCTPEGGPPHERGRPE